MQPLTLNANWLSPLTCSRCGTFVAKRQADFHRTETTLEATCRLCTIRDVDPKVPELLQTRINEVFPKVIDGKKFDPYYYQRLDALRISGMRSVLLNNEMGSGKTLTSVIGLIGACAMQGIPSMIFVPSSVKFNWREEIERWDIEDLKVKVVRSRKNFSLPEAKEVVVASIDCLPGYPCRACRKEAAKLRKAKHPRKATRVMRSCEHKEDQDAPLPDIDRPYLCLIDEIHMIQNDTMRRHLWDKLATRVFEAGGRLAGLTGTAISNKPEDLISILSALKLLPAVQPQRPDELMELFALWEAWEKPSMEAGYEGVREYRKRILERLRPVRVCRLRRHVLKHLPPVKENEPIKVELDERTMAQVEHCVQRLLATRRACQEIEGGFLENPDAEGIAEGEAERRKLLFEERVDFYFETRPWHTDDELVEAVQEALSSKDAVPTLGELSKLRKLISLAKIDAARAVIEKFEQAGRPLIVFCDHTSVLDKLFEGRKGWQVLKGSVSDRQRYEMVRRFQGGQIAHGLGVSIRAGAVGITLTRAADVLFIDWHWNPSNLRQSVDRVNRPGAEIHDEINVWRLEANHAIDRMVVDKVTTKLLYQRCIEDEEASAEGIESTATWQRFMRRTG